ncbi:hypothetical protein ACWA5Z_10760 [Testudinibacter sp. P80/BLE/0925]|uniref:hypothetical protein n=1 Tax=Testudinibacter sp. TW-1 TaxID=3417757 RepID=UPI003D35AD2D
MNYKSLLATAVFSMLTLSVQANGLEQRPIDGRLDGFDPTTKGGSLELEQRPIDGRLDGFDPTTKGGVLELEQRPIDGRLDGFDPTTKGGF